MENRETSIFKIVECLKQNNYSFSQILPTEKNYLKLPFEVLNLLNFVFWKRNVLFEWSAFPEFYQIMFKVFYPQTFSLFKMFFLNSAVKKDEIYKYFKEEEVNTFMKNGILNESNGCYKFNIKFIPYKEMILSKGTSWFGKDSVTFAEYLKKALDGMSFDKTLDLCTGTGIQAMVSSEYSKNVIASDVRSQSIQNANLNSKINNISDITFLTSDLFTKIEEKYDLITANPPYGIVAKDSELEEYGLSTVFELIENLDNYLNNCGVAMIFTESAIKNGNDLLFEKIKKVFKNKGYSITLLPLNYTINSSYFDTAHRKHGILYIPLYIITFRKDDKNVIKLLKLSLVRKMICSAYIALMYFRFYFGQKK